MDNIMMNSTTINYTPFFTALPTDPNMTTMEKDTFLSFPSPPSSTTSTEPGLDFDFDTSSFTHTSPDSSLFIDDSFAFDFNHIQSDNHQYNDFIATPAKQQANGEHLDFSPFYSSSLFSGNTFTQAKAAPPQYVELAVSNAEPKGDTATAEALSSHHFQRYLHYKTLAAQAEADIQNTAALKSHNDLNSLLASYSMNQFPLESNANEKGSMMGYQSYPTYTPEAQYLAYNPQQQAQSAHAQAEAHLQAHEVAIARAAQQQRMDTGYWVASNQSAIQPVQYQQDQAVNVPATFAPIGVSHPAPALTAPVNRSTPPPFAPASVPIVAPILVAFSAPSSLANSLEEESKEDELDQVSVSSSDLPIPNLNGGGRGYIPGQTPDDPKKRHKCGTCGRAFARAFNLKSHVQTHNPVRTKPHQCPHSTCKRGFSRLHDLERHRQGIHNDGPLVNAKSAGCSPSTLRAQGRINHIKRESSSSLSGLTIETPTE